jgi:hypothetical protein
MPEITVQSPLMQPVIWQGQEYFTSQYFHRQYLDNSQYVGKYKRHSDFLRTIRGIEAYTIYMAHGDIVEIVWKWLSASSDAVKQNMLYLKPLFQDAGYRPLTLLNATAQVALSHHLDDELSKQISVAANTQTARQMTGKGSKQLFPEEEAVRRLNAFLQIGRMFQTPEHIVQQEAVKQIGASTGVNLQAFLLAAPAQSNITQEEKMLEPKDLAKSLNILSAYAVNKALEEIGWQVKKIDGTWEPTPAGQSYASIHAWSKGPKSGYNLKWNVDATTKALKAAGYNFPAQEKEEGAI